VHAFQGSTGEFLQHPSGDPTTNLLALAREGLQAPLRAAVRRAIDEKQEVVVDARARRGSALRPIRIAVRPLRPAHTDGSMLTVSFFEREPVAEAHPPSPVEERRPESELEAELNATREELRFTLEQMESSNAELQASTRRSGRSTRSSRPRTRSWRPRRRSCSPSTRSCVRSITSSGSRSRSWKGEPAICTTF
jgi:two-component system, chemotaxis family, CheB/CheR fusion protein